MVKCEYIYRALNRNSVAAVEVCTATIYCTALLRWLTLVVNECCRALPVDLGNLHAYISFVTSFWHAAC